MKCSECNAEIADNAKFCPVCGAKVEKEEPVKICPNCGEVLKDGAKFCAKCGCKIEKECKCPKCGTAIKDGAKFCPVCGTKIVSGIEVPTTPLAVCEQEVPIGTTSESVSDATSTENAKGRKKSDKVIIIAAIAVLVVIVITIIAVSLSSNSDSQSNYYSGNDYGYSSNSNLSNTYSNEYISFKYPWNYKITDVEKDENGEISFNCEIKGDNLSCITIASGEDAGLAYAYEQEIKELSIETINTINSTLTSIYYDIKFSTISKKTVGNCKGYFCDFTAKAFSETVKGYTFVGVYVNYYVTIVTQAESDKYMQQLDEILSTLDVKAEALEGEWSTIR